MDSSYNQKYYNKTGSNYYGKKNYQKSNEGNYRNQSNQGNYQIQTKHYNNKNQQYQQYQPNRQREYFNPYLAQEMIYRTEMYIYTKYNNLIDLNIKNQELSQKLTENCSFFVIKSFSEEDVHKAIKFGVWSSSKNGNLTLSNSFKLAKEKEGNVYLFFSCNSSGRYVGVAKMLTECDVTKSFEYWTQDGKWPGLFEIEWVFIKDVPFKEFKTIEITMRDGEVKPVSNARDTQEIPYQHAKTMISKFESYQNTNTILEHFEFYDIRQENYEKQMKNATNE